jgi:hypothetical protein
MLFFLKGGIKMQTKKPNFKYETPFTMIGSAVILNE